MTSARSRLSADRQHTLRGKRTLDWFFQNRRWIKLADRRIQCAYALRELPADQAALQFLFVASKRDMKRAHDRNKAKRWLRAAVVETEAFSQFVDTLGDRQLLVMFRVVVKPQEISYSDIFTQMRIAAEKLVEITNQRTP